MFKKILIAYDGSNGAKLALKTAIDLAKHYDAELHPGLLLRLLCDLTTGKEKPETAVPFFWFPLCIEIRQFAVEVPPAPSALDHLLEFRKRLKGHRNSEFYCLPLKFCNDLITEKGTVHTNLTDDARAVCAIVQNNG